ncbi:C2H2-type zinc finger transcription factor [Phycomyces blakesleeanus]
MSDTQRFYMRDIKEGLKTVDTNNTTSESSDEEDEEVCFICTEPIMTYAVSECDHRTCHLCALRLRSLYKTRNCAYCKTEQRTVIFTHDPEKPFSSYTPEDTPFVDKNYDILFEDETMYKDTMVLLDYNCPEPTCSQKFNDYPQLKQHVQSAHGRMLCDLCVEHKKIFPHEHVLYTSAQLGHHYRYGDESSQDAGFKGHPECQFCSIHFYGDDELFAHCRDKHEQCHICVKRGRRHEYYADYDGLEMHFKDEHYLCLQRSCLEKKFVVFDTALDLKAHDVEEHSGSRKVDIIQFDYHSNNNRHHNRNGQQGSHQSPRQQNRQHHNNHTNNTARNSDNSNSNNSNNNSRPNVQENQQQKNQEHVKKETKKPSSTTSSASSSTTTANVLPPGANFKTKQKDKALMNKPANFGSLTEQTAAASSASSSTADPATVKRHTEFLERIKTMLKSAEKVNQFRKLTTAYRSSSMDVDLYVSNLSDLCGRNPENLSHILLGVEDLMDSKEKKREIAHAWRIRQASVGFLRYQTGKTSNFPTLTTASNRQDSASQFPMLPMASSRPQPQSKSPAPRVLVIKSKGKARAKQPANSPKAAWENIAPAAAKEKSNRSPGISENRPPSIPHSEPKPMDTYRPARVTAAPLVSPENTSRPSKKVGRNGHASDAFPSLPVAAPKHPVLVQMRRNNSNPSTPWGSDRESENEAPVEKTSNKKGKKGKQVLFRVGL